jgi:hypothetical protein
MARKTFPIKKHRRRKPGKPKRARKTVNVIGHSRHTPKRKKKKKPSTTRTRTRSARSRPFNTARAGDPRTPQGRLF